MKLNSNGMKKKAGLTRSRNSPDPKKENRKNKFKERTDGKIKFNSEKNTLQKNSPYSLQTRQLSF